MFILPVIANAELGSKQNCIDIRGKMSLPKKFLDTIAL